MPLFIWPKFCQVKRERALRGSRLAPGMRREGYQRAVGPWALNREVTGKQICLMLETWEPLEAG